MLLNNAFELANLAKLVYYVQERKNARKNLQFVSVITR